MSTENNLWFGLWWVGLVLKAFWFMGDGEREFEFKELLDFVCVCVSMYVFLNVFCQREGRKAVGWLL